jgi:hypothetical protein
MRPGARMFVGAAGIAVLIVGGLNHQGEGAGPAHRRGHPGQQPGRGHGKAPNLAS